jgi:hypothetical protein
LLRFVIVITLFLGVLGCRAGVSGLDAPENSVTYDLGSDGSKRFMFRSIKDPNRGAIRRAGGQFDPEDFAEYMKTQLENYLERDQYCREGYFVIDQSNHPGDGFIRGECKESATPEDIANWDV